MRDSKGLFVKKGEVSIDDAVLRAYEQQLGCFYLNQVHRLTLQIMKPQKPESTSVSAVLRRLRRKGKISYSANEVGIYTKLS